MSEPISEIPKNITQEQKPITAKPVEPLNPEQMRELNDKKTVQAQADEASKQNVLKAITDTTKAESDSKPEKSINEQLAEEQDKFIKSLYSDPAAKLLEIEKKIGEKAWRSIHDKGIPLDTTGESLKVYKDINDQLKRYAPPKYTGGRVVGQPFHSQRILSDMIEVDKDANVTYNPLIKLSPLKGLYSGITDKFNLKNAKNMNTNYINISGVKELRDYYTKAKAAEAAAKQKPS